jgi:dienelactone hydrolase
MVATVSALWMSGCASLAPFEDVVLEDGTVLEAVAFRNDHGETVKALYALPDATAPVPAVIVLHGSGGLFDPPDWGEDHDIGPQFADWAARLLGEGYAVLMPDSFYSRGFYEWGDHPGELDKTDRLALRVYDAYAALAFACRQPEIDCNRVAVLGFSNGGSAAALVVHERLEDIALLSDLRPADQRPSFALSIPYYPGCLFDHLLSTDTEDPDAFYRPTAPVHVQHGEDDDLLDGCELRLEQTDTLTALEDWLENPFHLYVYDAGHSFDSDPSNAREETVRLEARQLTLELLAGGL